MHGGTWGQAVRGFINSYEAAWLKLEPWSNWCL